MDWQKPGKSLPKRSPSSHEDIVKDVLLLSADASITKLNQDELFFSRLGDDIKSLDKSVQTLTDTLDRQVSLSFRLENLTKSIIVLTLCNNLVEFSPAKRKNCQPCCCASSVMGRGFGPRNNSRVRRFNSHNFSKEPKLKRRSWKLRTITLSPHTWPLLSLNLLFFLSRATNHRHEGIIVL